MILQGWKWEVGNGSLEVGEFQYTRSLPHARQASRKWALPRSKRQLTNNTRILNPPIICQHHRFADNN